MAVVCVLDLDHTLIASDVNTDSCAVREGAYLLLDILQRCNIIFGIYSLGGKDYVQNVLNACFTRFCFSFVISREDYPEKGKAVQHVLHRLRNLYPYISLFNTKFVLVDDLASNSKFQAYAARIVVRPFVTAHCPPDFDNQYVANCWRDNRLFDLEAYLNVQYPMADSFAPTRCAQNLYETLNILFHMIFRWRQEYHISNNIVNFRCDTCTFLYK